MGERTLGPYGSRMGLDGGTLGMSGGNFKFQTPNFREAPKKQIPSSKIQRSSEHQDSSYVKRETGLESYSRPAARIRGRSSCMSSAKISMETCWLPSLQAWAGLG